MKYSNLLTTTHDDDDDDDGTYAFGNPIWGTKHFHLLALPTKARMLCLDSL
jgi:hypothetical protein